MNRRSLLSLSAITAFGLAMLPGSAVSQQPTITSPIVGLWKQTSHVQKVVATGAMRHPFGERPTGYQLFTRGGHLMSLMVGENRKAPAGRVASDAERVALFNTVNARSGTYRVEGSKVVERIDASQSQSDTGTERTYAVEIVGNKLTLTSSPIRSTGDGEEIITVRTFDRVE